MNTDHSGIHVHRLEGLVVVVDESAGTTTTEVSKTSTEEGEITARGDELETVEKLHKVAEILETKHLDEEAHIVKEHMKELVAKQLNEFDGFDR